MTTIIRRFLVLLGVINLALVFALPATTLAATDVFKDVCSKPGTSESAVCQKDGNTTSNPLTGPNGLIVKITRIVAIIGGAAAVIIIIISGLRYILSDGDAKQTSEARSGILYAAVGLIIIVLAASIISWVMNEIYK
jgi:hypothetical protein